MADDDPRERIQLSFAQIAASCLAAISAAVLCSFFGVAGTVIGTAIASLFATLGSALYAHSMRRTKARLRQLHQAGAASPPLTEVVKTARQHGRRWLGQIPLRPVAIGAVAVFVISTAVVTGIELGVGKPLSALLGVSHSGDRATSFGSALHAGPHRKKKPTPKPSKSSSSPTATPTPTVTVTPTPTHSKSSTSSPTPSSPLSTLLPPSSTTTPTGKAKTH